MAKQNKLTTEVISVDPQRPEMSAIQRAADVIRAGGLVAFPTETVYGLGANALDPQAVSGIFEAKGRPATNPLIVHVTGPAQARDLAAEWPPLATLLADAFWPGPLTLVVKKLAVIPDIVTAVGETVALRSPAHPVAAALIEAAGVPIAAPSANRSTRISPTTAQHVLKGLSGRIDMVLDGGPTTGGIESTVLDVTVDPPRLLRPGLVSCEEIERVVGLIAAAAGGRGREPLRSPGMLERHYAPNAPVELAVEDGLSRAVELADSGLTVGWITMVSNPAGRAGITQVIMPDDARQYAQRLYSALHEIDDASLDRILVDFPPDTPEWRAVRDRLHRAATHPKAADRTTV